MCYWRGFRAVVPHIHAMATAGLGLLRHGVFVPEHLRLQAVWIAEEHTQLGAEIRYGAIRRPQVHQAHADVFERLAAAGVETKMIDTPTPKHGGLETGLRIARDLEHIQFAPRPERQNHHAFAWMTRMVPLVVLDGGIECFLIEADTPLHVRGQHGDVVHTLYQCSHGDTPPYGPQCLHTWAT